MSGVDQKPKSSRNKDYPVSNPAYELEFISLICLVFPLTYFRTRLSLHPQTLYVTAFWLDLVLCIHTFLSQIPPSCSHQRSSAKMQTWFSHPSSAQPFSCCPSPVEMSKFLHLESRSSKTQSLPAFSPSTLTHHSSAAENHLCISTCSIFFVMGLGLPWAAAASFLIAASISWSSYIQFII